MKIAVISTPIFKTPVTGYAGLEVIAYHCAKGLAAKGHKVYLIAPDGSECPGAEVIPVGPAGQVSEEMAYGGYPEVKENDFVKRRPHAGYWQHLLEVDCIIDHSWSKWSAMLKLEGRLTCPILGVCHAPIHTMYASLPPEGVVSFVCISEDQKTHFEALHSPRRARVAYNGIDLNYYKATGVPRTDRFLFLARFSTIKGPDLAVEACRKAGVGLDLVGDVTITNEPELYEKCVKLADGKQIRIIGNVSRGETVYWYSRAHAFLHPNLRFREPLGLAPLEAQACGLPVGAWRYGAMPETVKHGETGFLVDSLGELEGLIRNKAFDGLRRERCREWASQFSLEKMVSAYERLCEEAVGKGAW